ncbi:winged helix DNA-binding domain-containing protein [Phytoactinopolyspora endophytica]|uniref:winged helix DNA-binding domain-containing protein n=1 Tax=Phytoactinopolyspora endophytica TaxID=1642495 RepID=UPI00197C3702|nr:winged helix DNA-binding domain-containing protein [Phytoactinopolyspora endophytica]
MQTTNGDGVLSQRALNRATLERQLLLRRSEVTPLQAVEHLAGLQAQAPYSPYFQLWSRVADFDPGELGQLLEDRAVVRIAAMRGTVHMLTAADCLTFRPLTQRIFDRDLDTNTQYAAGVRGLDPAEFVPVVQSLLADTPRTSAELAPLLAERFPGHDPASLAYAARGLLALIQAPPRAVWGKSGQARLTTAESWLGRELDPTPSIEAMVLRYLKAFGPASVVDVQMWSGLTRLREVVDRLRPQLRVFRAENGKELFDLPDAPRPDPDTPAPVRLLPDFDNLIRSHADRTRVVSDQDMKRLSTRNGVTPNFFLVDGMVAGSWRITKERRSATLRVQPFRRLLRADHRAVGEEAERVLTFAEPQADCTEIAIENAL